MNESVTEDLASDLENWMSLLPQELRKIPIINVAIPGSHDSFTANVSANSDISPDAEKIVQELAFLGPLLKEVIANWSKTQSYLARDQLLRGIRYFDLRTSTKTGTEDLYIVHSLYSVPIQGCLDEINDFLNLHPKEVVILDFQHFYGFDENIHAKFIRDINNTFGTKILPYSNEMDKISLEIMTQDKYQVIVIYRLDGTTFWPSASFPNPWPDTMSIPTLIQSLDNNLKNRRKEIAFISQCVLTPDAKFIIEHVTSNLEEKCAKDLENDRSKWIEAQSAGAGGLNIIIADFIELSDCKYVRDVINVNRNLLKVTNK